MIAPFQDALVLTGPTGSGKTQLAINLAKRIDAEIVSMDSMAMYRHMDIGTAKPIPEQRSAVPHHLVDVLDPSESASVAWWLREAGASCAGIRSRGKQILFVGGTPLYLKALLFGLFDGPPGDRALRERLQQEAGTNGGPALHEKLAQVDPAAAQRLHPNDSRRIIRALEVFELTGKPISAWQRQWNGGRERGSGGEGENQKQVDTETRTKRDGNLTVPLSPSPSLPRSPAQSAEAPAILWLDLPRPVLYDRINRRVAEMFAAGLVEEVRALAKLDPAIGREARQALGYKEVFDYLAGRFTLEETIALVQTRSRNFAKRQITWFRHLPGCFPATPQLTEELWQPRIKV